MDMGKLAALPPLARGPHKPSEGKACVMEAAAMFAGERWGDRAECVCPVIAATVRPLNDAMPDTLRDALLRPLIPMLVGTRSTPDVERRRAYIAADYAVREAASAALRAVGLHAEADRLAALAEIVDVGTAQAATAAAWTAATAATAAWSAADAAQAAAQAAARAADAARAANTAWAAAQAARATAFTAAQAASASEDAAPIWRGAADCIRRMCEVR